VPTHRSVFKDETKLDINYVPYKLPHRETELRLLMEFFSFALQSPEKMAQRVMKPVMLALAKLRFRNVSERMSQAKQTDAEHVFATFTSIAANVTEASFSFCNT
jgi:hypothetical protein